MKMLIVEDEFLIAQSLQLELEDYGFEITGIAPAFDKAVSLIQKDKPDLVLSDMNLKSKEDGIDVTRWLNEYDINIPVILMTGYDIDSLKERLAEVTFLTMIQKPIEASDVINVVNKNKL